MIPEGLPTNFAVVFDDRVDLFFELEAVLNKLDTVLSPFKLGSGKHIEKSHSELTANQQIFEVYVFELLQTNLVILA